ncbi:hypothetical protein A3L11_09435 [Thermococcus siculi]|uniref:Uncharacterized protein n=1 Tax=Thermococcus siculi TaxID=72803 RepID=A0A2Z2MNL5_9EURY|nr:hypothetical protein [Thermococcus siculi]ASJ09438.1 hypothetical protein A3L11_09435 [Thermococcus siculi]
MRKMVLEAYEIRFLTRLFTGFLVLFLATILLIIVELVGEGASQEALTGLLIYLVFAIVVVWLMVFSLRKMGEGPKRAARLAEETVFEGNRLVFPAELEFDYGRVTLTERPQRARPWKGFKRTGRRRASALEFPDEGFKFVATGEKGFADFPAIMITTKPYERTVIIFMTDRGEVTAKKLVTGTATGENLGVEVEGRRKELIGRFYSLPGKEKRVEVFLSAPENPEVAVKIGDSSTAEFRHPMLPDEKIVVFCPYGSLSIGNLLRTLKHPSTALGHGEFLLGFRLPRRGGELATYKFEVVLKEGPEW